MEEAARPSSTEDQVTFNVVYTGGSVARLLPLSLSLLQSPGVRVRVIANGCDRAEVELLHAVADSEERLSHHDLGHARPVQHGIALNHVFEAYPEPRFAFADSDVFASGNFLEALALRVPGQAAAFSADHVWRSDGESVAGSRRFILTGSKHQLSDGTYLGNSYCAIYERDAVEPLWRAAPNGFANTYGYQLSRRARAALASRGWRWRLYDTARVVNLQLLMAGFTLEERAVPELHHLGGFSVEDVYVSRPMVRRVATALRASSHGGLRQFAHEVLMRIYFELQDDPTQGQGGGRRRAGLAYLNSVLDAIVAGEPLPPAPKTDSAGVDRRVAELVAALEAEYPGWLARVRRASEAAAQVGVHSG